MSVIYSPTLYTLDSPSIIVPSLTPGIVQLPPSIVNLTPGTVTLTPGFLVPEYKFPLPQHLDLNQQEETHNMLTKYYYYRTLDDWLWNDMNNILGYLVVNNNNVNLIKNLKDYSNTNTKSDTQESTEKKIDFIEKNILSLESMRKLLKKFVKESGIKWTDMSKNHYFLKKVIRKYLSAKMKVMIENK